MGEIVNVGAYRVELVEPEEAGAYDPPMQEWLALEIANQCPSCGSTHWGTVNPRGYFLVRVCHDEFGRGCRQNFRPPVTPEMIASVVGALTGKVRRFGMA